MLSFTKTVFNQVKLLNNHKLSANHYAKIIKDAIVSDLKCQTSWGLNYIDSFLTNEARQGLGTCFQKCHQWDEKGKRNC